MVRHEDIVAAHFAGELPVEKQPSPSNNLDLGSLFREVGKPTLVWRSKYSAKPEVTEVGDFDEYVGNFNYTATDLVYFLLAEPFGYLAPSGDQYNFSVTNFIGNIENGRKEAKNEVAKAEKDDAGDKFKKGIAENLQELRLDVNANTMWTDRLAHAVSYVYNERPADGREERDMAFA